MGLMIHSLEMLSSEAKRDYFIYLLDYGWEEPISNSLRQNFSKMADFASKNDAAIIMGVGEIGHFDNEVLSWHSINGESAESLLPAILITKTNPHKFREYTDFRRKSPDDDFDFLLIPLKKICKTPSDVTSLLQELFLDIKNKQMLTKFSVKKKLKRGIGRSIVDSIILQPNISGVGIDLKKIFSKEE